MGKREWLDSEGMEIMNASNLNLETYFCGLKYFEGINHKVAYPTADQVEHAIDQLQYEIDDTTRTVEIWRMPTPDNLTNQFCMQFQGECDKFIISLSKNYEIFAEPNFDLYLGERGETDVIGNYWPSRLVCTDIAMVKNIAVDFALRGKLAYPDIWEIWED